MGTWKSVEHDGYIKKDDVAYWVAYKNSDCRKPCVSENTILGCDLKKSLVDFYIEAEKPKFDYKFRTPLITLDAIGIMLKGGKVKGILDDGKNGCNYIIKYGMIFCEKSDSNNSDELIKISLEEFVTKYTYFIEVWE